MDAERRLVIYGLVDPRTSELRYVGRTAQKGLARLAEHRFPSARRGRTHKSCWIAELQRAGFEFEAFIIEELASGTINDLDEAERFWISYFRSIGARLTNATDGGDGWAFGDRNPMRDPVARAKYSESNKGRKFTDDHRKRIGAATARHYQNPATPRLTGDANPAKGAVARAKITARLTGHLGRLVQHRRRSFAKFGRPMMRINLIGS